MSDTLSSRVTLRVSTDHIAALDGLVAAGRYPNRSAALRSAVEELLTREARLIAVNVSEPTQKHLPDGGGASLCGLGDDADLTQVPRERGAGLTMCRGCDPFVDDEQRPTAESAQPGTHTEVSIYGHE